MTSLLRRFAAPPRAFALTCTLLMLIAGAASAQSAAGSGAGARALTGDLAAVRERALELVNRARGEHGLEPLTSSESLSAAAQDHAEDMLARGYYSHRSPEGADAADRYRAQGGTRWALVAENIASCSPCAGPPGPDRIERLHEGWMDSPGHRENILNAGLSRLGFGIAAGESGPLYAVQVFAGPGAPRGAAGGTARPLPPGETANAFARAVNERRPQSAPSLQPSPALSALAEGLLPDSPGGVIDLDPPGGLIGALPAGAQNAWRSLSVLSGTCGGCGAERDMADLDHFLDMWIDDPRLAETLRGGGATALGFALRAYGNGRKAAVAVLGRGR